MSEPIWQGRVNTYLAAQTADDYRSATEGLGALSDTDVVSAYDWALSEQSHLDNTYAGRKVANLNAFKMLIRQGRGHEARPFLCTALDYIARKRKAVGGAAT